MSVLPESRRTAPRASVDLDLRLSRAKGSEVHGHTLNVGRGGMCVSTTRPLVVDELLSFDVDLSAAGQSRHLAGAARVLREQGANRYALRFERLGQDGDAALEALVGRLAS